VNIADALKKHNFPEEAAQIITANGIKTFFPPQAEAVKKGVLKGKSLLLSVPTAAGKTLIAEMCMVQAILKDKGRCLYIAPLKALASEKFNDFKNKYEKIGIKVGVAVGDIDSPSRHLNKYDIIVATAEKVDSLIRSKAKWLINSLSVVVLDEIHFINDGSRGPTMEILTARIKQLNPQIQILGLSATIRNADEMADWLNAELVQSSWRPIPLHEGVYFNEQINFQNGPTRVITEEAPDDISKLALDTLRGKGQVLVFVNSRRSAQAVSRQVCKSVAKVLTAKEKQELISMSKKIAGGRSTETKLCRKLADVVLDGAAFHHAGLKPHQRELVENAFRKNLIKVIGCTPTLAAGVNLPARRAIIRDCKRFESGVGQAYIPTSEYKQCAGRAGRPQYDEYGEAVIMAKTSSEAATLFERYIEAEPEPVISKLANESALRIHILSSVAGGYVHDVKGMLEFIEHTFLYHQKHHPDLLGAIADIFEFLHNEKFIEKSGFKFFATPLGALTSRLYIDPFTSITLRDGLKCLDKDSDFTAIGILHLISCCPDSPSLNIGKKDMGELEDFASHFTNDFILTADNFEGLDDYYAYLSTLKTSWLLLQWIEEDREDEICDKFNTGPGDVYRIVESFQWLLYAAGKVAEMQRKKKLTFQLEELRRRVRYGIKEELLEIISLKNIGRIRARHMFNHNIKSYSDLNKITEEKLSNIPQIGKALAKDIMTQMLKKPSKTPAVGFVTPINEADEWEE